MTKPSFSSHRAMEFTLAANLDRLFAVASGLALDELAAQIRETRSRIEDHRFSIAVVGEFKRGKSTFINALLGKEILPSDVLPTSATVNRVTYALRPGVEIVFKGGETRRIDIAELAEYVTKLTPEAEAMASTIEEAVVHYPIPFCKNNVDIIDTPGLSDDVAMTEVTLGVLPRVDAAILVILATAPFSQSEARFLESLLVEYGLGSVVFVVTAIDRLRRSKERERVLAAVTERVRDAVRRHAAAHFGEGSEAFKEYLRRVGEPRVFGLSGYDALIGKTERDEELLAESRFTEFEAFLERFLTEESGLVALRTHSERTLGYCTALLEELGSRGKILDPAGDDTDFNALDALLRSLEWLARDTRRRLAEQRDSARERLRPRADRLSDMYRKTAEAACADLEPTSDDLEPDRLPAFMERCRDRLIETLDAVSAEMTREVLAKLRSRVLPAISDLLELAAAFDRVISHVQGVLESVLGAGRPAVETMTSRLGGTAASSPWGEAAVEAAARVTFDASAQRRRDAVLELFSLPPLTVDDLTVSTRGSTGPRLMKRAVDFVRIEKFKPELRRKLTEAVLRRTEASRQAREQAWDQQVVAGFTVLENHLDQALDEVRNWRAQLQAGRHSLAVRAEQDRRKLEQTSLEIESIRDRSRELTRQLDSVSSSRDLPS